ERWQADAVGKCFDEGQSAAEFQDRSDRIIPAGCESEYGEYRCVSDRSKERPPDRHRQVRRGAVSSVFAVYSRKLRLVMAVPNLRKRSGHARGLTESTRTARRSRHSACVESSRP